ncbi:MAG: hypothetical protein ACREOB_13205, partial [Thermodesulfobacteriota bacterium]
MGDSGGANPGGSIRGIASVARESIVHAQRSSLRTRSILLLGSLTQNTSVSVVPAQGYAGTKICRIAPKTNMGTSPGRTLRERKTHWGHFANASRPTAPSFSSCLYTVAIAARTCTDRSVIPGPRDIGTMRGGKDMKRRSIAALLIRLGLALTMVVPYSLQAAERGNFTDFRGRSYTEDDLAKSLFGQTPPYVGTRGIGPAQPPTATTSATSSKPAVALNIFFEFNSDKILQGYYGDLDK